jgi:muramidase (phage lysozyme)
MASRRSLRFNADVDEQLLSLIEKVAGGYQPYDVELFSGYRPKNRLPGSEHGKHAAIDFNLIDRKTGKALPNIRDPSSARDYQAFANAVYQAADPELQKQLRWGGYFTQGQPRDWMHLDLGGADRMAAGTWQGGFNKDLMAQLGLDQPGGVEAVAKAAGVSVDDVRSAFLSTIAGTEAPAYNTLYGGGTFGDDYSQHPNRKIPITKGPNKGDYSTAAGRYQFLNSTWADEQKRLGLKDFSPASQDAAAWDLAARTYSDATKGGDLMEALNSGDPARINAAAQVLNKQWTSLPGGIEQAGGYGNSTFYDVYSKNLGGKGTPVASSTDAGKSTASPYALPDKGDTKKSWAEQLGDDIGAVNFGAASGGYTAPPVAQPGAANTTAAVPKQDPAAFDARRQQLALAMQRLNQGVLF